jgi:hypothetical protein
LPISTSSASTVTYAGGISSRCTTIVTTPVFLICSIRCGLRRWVPVNIVSSPPG